MISKQSTNTQSSIKRALESTPRICLYFLLIFTPLARGSVQGWAITNIHIITLIALTAFLLDKTLNGDWKWIKTPFDKPILALLILCAVSSYFSIHRPTSFWAMILLINYIIIFYLTIHTIDTKTKLLKILYIIIGIAAFLAIFGLFKRTGTNPFPWWHYPEIKSEVYRLSATFGNANHMAGYMEMTLLLFLGLLLSGFKEINRLALVGCIIFFGIALTLSLSRGGWISAGDFHIHPP
jgi:O-antigen ligase